MWNIPDCQRRAKAVALPPTTDAFSFSPFQANAYKQPTGGFESDFFPSTIIDCKNPAIAILSPLRNLELWVCTGCEQPRDPGNGGNARKATGWTGKTGL